MISVGDFGKHDDERIAARRDFNFKILKIYRYATILQFRLEQDIMIILYKS